MKIHISYMTFDGILAISQSLWQASLFFFFKFYFSCLNVLPACKHVCCMNALCSTEEGVRSLRAGVTDDCEMSDMGL